MGHLAGVRIARRIDNGAMERFTTDALNQDFAGELRDARIEFWGNARDMADVLEPVAHGIRMLATLEDYFRMPVRIDEAVPLTPFVRLSPDGKRGTIVLLNTGLDPIAHATLRVRMASHKVALLTPIGETARFISAHRRCVFYGKATRIQ